MDNADLKSWIGQTESVQGVLSPPLAGQFAATLDLKGEFEEGTVAPAMIHWCLAQENAATSALAAEGHPPRGGFLPPVTLPRRMWAGGEVTFLAPLRVGDAVTRRSTIKDVAMKQGGSGPLCFVTVEHEFESGGQAIVLERQDIVYRAAANAGAPAEAAKVASEGENREIVTPSRSLLFRYSAVTFNAHRIHYDVAYAREHEGYPGLVVHGPLQATLLCHYAERLWGSAPRRFAFRSVSPIFDTEDFSLNAERDGEGLRLWTAQVGGPVAMQATASW